MKQCRLLFYWFIMLGVLSPGIDASDWQLKKDKNGIQVFTKQKDDSQVYMYKVVTSVMAKPEHVYRQVVDFAGNLKYMELVDSINFLEHKADELYRNYMRFNMPWPVKNRDVVMEMTVKKEDNVIYLESTNLPDYLPRNQGIIRIEEFNEKWVIKKGSQPGHTQIIVTGWVDPGGSIPIWVVKLSSVRTPYRFISGIIEEVRASR